MFVYLPIESEKANVTWKNVNTCKDLKSNKMCSDIYKDLMYSFVKQNSNNFTETQFASIPPAKVIHLIIPSLFCLCSMLFGFLLHGI